MARRRRSRSRKPRRKRSRKSRGRKRKSRGRKSRGRKRSSKGRKGKHTMVGKLSKKPNFKNNLYYVMGSGVVKQYNKKSKRKSNVGKVNRPRGHMCFVKKNGGVYCTPMKTKGRRKYRY